jgi:hypothetical protein
MDNGARGATLNHLEMRSYSAAVQEQTKESHSREFCDIIIPAEIEENILTRIQETGLFGDEHLCILKVVSVEKPEPFRHIGS